MATSGVKLTEHVFITRAGGRTSTKGAISHAKARQQFRGENPVGQSKDTNIVVYSDDSAESMAAANAVLKTADADFAQVSAWFGDMQLPAGQNGDDVNIPRTALPIRVLTDPQAGGAYHFGCDATDLYIEPTPQMASGLMVAELVEVFEAAIANGWDCGHTNGEGLSRVLAAERNPDLKPILVPTVQSWLANGAQDYVTSNNADDRNQDANGCSTLFLYYLNGKLGFSWQAITTAGGATLYDCYQRLTHDTKSPKQCFDDFVTTVNGLGAGGLDTLPPKW